MIRRKLLKPRKVVWIMRDFINDIHGLTYTDILIPSGLTVKEMVEYLRSAEEIELPSRVKMVYLKEEGFGVLTSEKEEQEFHFFYNLEQLHCKGSRQFSQDIFSRCPMTRGFASITLTILHELGHMNAQQEFEGYDRETAIKELEKNFPKETINFEYFKLPDEKAATDWAIEWLSHPENRKKAKAFEKKFFDCFSK